MVTGVNYKDAINKLAKIIGVLIILGALFSGGVELIYGIDLESDSMIFAGLGEILKGLGLGCFVMLLIDVLGEIVELLVTINLKGKDSSQEGPQVQPTYIYPTQTTVQQQTSYRSPSEMNSSAASLTGESWFCSACGTKNSVNYGQCKKCGKFRAN